MDSLNFIEICMQLQETAERSLVHLAASPPMVTLHRLMVEYVDRDTMH